MSKNPEGQFPVLQYWLGEHSTCTPVTPAAEHSPCTGLPGLALALQAADMSEWLNWDTQGIS